MEMRPSSGGTQLASLKGRGKTLTDFVLVAADRRCTAADIKPLVICIHSSDKGSEALKEADQLAPDPVPIIVMGLHPSAIFPVTSCTLTLMSERRNAPASESRLCIWLQHCTSLVLQWYVPAETDSAREAATRMLASLENIMCC